MAWLEAPSDEKLELSAWEHGDPPPWFWLLGFVLMLACVYGIVTHGPEPEVKQQPSDTVTPEVSCLFRGTCRTGVMSA